MTQKIIEIIPFTEQYKSEIKKLNIEWLEKYFYVEETDIIMLSNPNAEIIDKGGKIFYAKYLNEIVGTFSLLKIDDFTFELSKMAVTEKYQGLGIGNKLMKFCLLFAKENKIKSLILFSNTKLVTAIQMYQKFGFTEIDLGTSIYKRSNIKMEKIL